MLKFLGELGVKLDIFFRLLWRHVFVVEILRSAFSINSQRRKQAFSDWIKATFSRAQRQHTRAIEYLETWGETFWKDTDYRIKELATNLETELRASIEGSIPGLKLNATASDKLEESQKVEVIQRAQEVVNRVQIKELSQIMDMLAGVLEEEQKDYFVLVDRLDENWIEDRLRYLLIRALIETVRDFSKVKRAKLIIVLRRDLIDRVFRLTRDAGFQEEKYRALCLPLHWTRESLVNMLNVRFNKLTRFRAKTAQGCRELLCDRVGDASALDYILDRTFLRPRDVLTFVNLCISKSGGHPKIGPQAVRAAEGDYSRDRLRSLIDEWYADYPNFNSAIDILKKRPPVFSVGDIPDNDIADFCCGWILAGCNSRDELADLARDVVDTRLQPQEMLRRYIHIFYIVGAVGLKLETYDEICWSYLDSRSISFSEIRGTTRVVVHRALWRVLGVASQ